MAIPINPKNSTIGIPRIDAPARGGIRLPDIQQQRTEPPRLRPRPTEPPTEPPDEPEPVDDGWAVDAKTGKRYKRIPKSDFGSGSLLGKDAGVIPTLHLTDLDTDNLSAEADTYLAHLRVAPNKEEQKRLLAAKAEAMRKANAQYNTDQEVLTEKENEVEERKQATAEKRKRPRG